LGAEREPYRAVGRLVARRSGLAQAPELRTVRERAARHARAPVFFIQAENDHDLAPTRMLSAAKKGAGKQFQVRI
jgi:hypothetical protein